MKEILDFIQQKSEKHNKDHKEFMEILDKAKNPGLIVNERIINLPV